MSRLVDEYKKVTKGAPVWAQIAGVVFGLLFLAGGIGTLSEDKPTEDKSASSSTTTQKTKPAPVAPTTAPEPVDISAEDMVDVMGNEAQFCKLYANGLSAGATEDFLFGNFLRGYQRDEIPGAPPAREVFDELVSRC